MSSFMRTPLEIARPTTPIAEVARRLVAHHVSALPIVDDRGAVAGVVSRHDLVRHQRRHPRAGDAVCADVMTAPVVMIEPRASLRSAARLMVDRCIHRVFVADGERLLGVLTTTDLTRAVELAGITRPLDSLMKSAIVMVRVDESLARALELLDRVHLSGLIVSEHDWPIGVFTQEDALAARELPLSTEIGALYDPSLICLPRQTTISRAAAHCASLGVRRIVVCATRDFVGIVSGLDFARVVAAA